MKFSRYYNKLTGYLRGHKDKPVYYFFNYLYYIYKRNNWVFDLSRLYKDFRGVKIDRPVFLLGTKGGGLTLISRAIRRHQNFVSVTGNSRYWSGADEMALVLGSILPKELAGIEHQVPNNVHPPTNWIYGTDQFLDEFRNTKQDVTPEVRNKFRKIIRWLLARHAINANKARFIDKSQIYTVKVSFINEILKDTNPKFILITRNPYAICFKGAGTNSFKENGISSPKKQLTMTAQLWKNSVGRALRDSQEADLLTLRLEDFLKDPQSEFIKICNFIGIDFDKELLPQKDQKVPFGTKDSTKWYPIKTDVNQKYFNKMSQKDVEIIDEVVGKYARKFNYEKPQVE